MLEELTSSVDSLSLSVCIFRHTTPYNNAIKHFIMYLKWKRPSKTKINDQKKKKFMGLKLFTDVFKGMTHSLDFKSNI